VKARPARTSGRTATIRSNRSSQPRRGSNQAANGQLNARQLLVANALLQMPIPTGYTFICLPIHAAIARDLGKSLAVVPENNGGDDESPEYSAKKHELPLFIGNDQPL
jgi:hypothetical protein